MSVNDPRGFIPKRHLFGGVIRPREFSIQSGYAQSLYAGDPVSLSGGFIVRADEVDRPIGVLASVELVTPANEPRRLRFWPGGTVARQVRAWVYDDPGILYRIQVSGEIDEDAIGAYAKILDWSGVSGSAAFGFSRQQLDVTSIEEVRTGQWVKIVALAEGETFSQWNDVLALMLVKGSGQAQLPLVSMGWSSGQSIPDGSDRSLDLTGDSGEDIYLAFIDGNGVARRNQFYSVSGTAIRVGVPDWATGYMMRAFFNPVTVSVAVGSGPAHYTGAEQALATDGVQHWLGSALADVYGNQGGSDLTQVSLLARMRITEAVGQQLGLLSLGPRLPAEADPQLGVLRIRAAPTTGEIQAQARAEVSGTDSAVSGFNYVPGEWMWLGMIVDFANDTFDVFVESDSTGGPVRVAKSITGGRVFSGVKYPSLASFPEGVAHAQTEIALAMVYNGLLTDAHLARITQDLDSPWDVLPHSRIKALWQMTGESGVEDLISANLLVDDTGADTPVLVAFTESPTATPTQAGEATWVRYNPTTGSTPLSLHEEALFYQVSGRHDVRYETDGTVATGASPLIATGSGPVIIYASQGQFSAISTAGTGALTVIPLHSAQPVNQTWLAPLYTQLPLNATLNWGGLDEEDRSMDFGEMDEVAITYRGVFGRDFNLPSLTQVTYLRSKRPTIEVLGYCNTSVTTVDESASVEVDKENLIAHWKSAELDATAHPSGIDDSETVLTLTAVTGIKASTKLTGVTSTDIDNYVSWIMIDSELMRVDAIDGMDVTVVRNWDGTAAAVHAASSAVLSPVYMGDFHPDGPAGQAVIRYNMRRDTAAVARYIATNRGDKTEEVKALMQVKGTTGVHVDIHSPRFFDPVDGAGNTVTVWNFATAAGYTDAEALDDKDIQTREIQDRVFLALGVYPDISCNNNGGQRFFDNGGGAHKLVQVTAEKPLPCNSVVLEAVFSNGFEKLPGSIVGGSAWKSRDQWEDNIATLSVAHQNALSADPWIKSAGQPQLMDEPSRLHERFDYASCLLAWETCFPQPQIKLPAFYDGTLGEGQLVFTKDRPEAQYLYMDLGRPAQAFDVTIDDFTDNTVCDLTTLLDNSNTFNREWGRGRVLVNADRGFDLVSATKGAVTQFDTAAAHGLAGGETVKFEGFSEGEWASTLNDEEYVITVIDTDTFQISENSVAWVDYTAADGTASVADTVALDSERIWRNVDDGSDITTIDLYAHEVAFLMAYDFLISAATVAEGSVVGTATTDVSGTVTWTLIGGTALDFLAINPSNGQITVTDPGPFLDHDETKRWTLIVHAFNGANHREHEVLIGTDT